MLAFSGRNGETLQLSLDERRGGADGARTGGQLGEGERGDNLQYREAIYEQPSNNLGIAKSERAGLLKAEDNPMNM